MSNKLIILVLLVGIIYSTSAAPEKIKCGPNQEFAPCGSVCSATCKNPSPSACTLPCNPGCRCIHGFVRNDNNECILQKDC